MRRLKMVARVLGVLIALGVVAGFVIRNYVIRAVILSEVRKQYGGRVELGDWWLNGTSAGITGIALGETAQPDSPIWLSAGRITTDVSIGRLLRGQFLPTRVEVDQPKLTLKFDPKGQLATPLPLKVPRQKDAASKPTIPLPEVIVKGAEVTVTQGGRPPLTIHRADATLVPKNGQEVIEAITDDPVWGHVRVAAQFDPSFQNGSVTIDSSPGFVVDPEQVKKIPFIPAEVWDNLEARGPVDAHVELKLALEDPVPVHVLTKLKLNGAWVKLDPLQVESTDTTGEVTVDDAQVRVDQIRGKTINGTLRAAGTLDFAQDPPDLNVDLRLRGIDVTRTPAAWQLNELGATGTLTGKVGLRVKLAADGIDLTGTTGRAVIEDGSLQGIPIKSLSINMKAQGNDLQFETQPSNQPVDKAALETAPTIPNTPPRPVAAADRGKTPGKPGAHPHPHPQPQPAQAESPLARVVEPVLAALPLIRIYLGDEGFLGWTAFAVSEIVERHTSKTTTPPGSKLRLPKSITTKIELEDVDLQTILAKVEKFGIKPPFPIAGRFSVKATATIPLDALRNIRGYVIHGDASLSRASIDYVDLGELAAHLDVENGVVNLSDFRGVLVDKPSAGGPAPAASPTPPRTGPLPDGGFRATFRAEIDPRGMATAKIEGKRLPLGELFAPVLPVPTPLSGDLTIQTEASVNLASLLDPRAYRVQGNFESRRIAYQGAKLDRVAAKFAVREGRADLAELTAQLAGRPLAVHGGLNLTPPYAFNGSGHVDGWQIGELAGFVPSLSQRLAVAGRLDATADASGTLFPFSIQTLGGVRLAGIKVGPVQSRYVVAEWRTENGVIVLSGLDAAIFGGKITGDARVPTKPGPDQRLDLNLVLKGIDTRELSKALPSQAVAITGVADGGVKLTMPLDASTVDADINLIAPDLSFRPEGRSGTGVQVESLRITAQAHNQLVTYQASAESLGAKLHFGGTFPIVAADPLRGVANAAAQVDGFRLGDAWRGLGMSRGLAELDGTGSFDANLRGTVEPPRLWSRGLFDLHDLRYGTRLPIGDIRGQVVVSPTSWKLEGVQGTLFGGVASGGANGTIRSGALGAAAFEFKVDRAAVAKLLASAPSLARGASGYGSLRAAGRLDESLHLSAEVDIPRAQILNLTLTDVRVPADIDVSPASGVGMAQARRWTGRLAGGSIDGKAWARLGTDRSFQSDIRLNAVDLEVLARIGAISSKASSGKLSGTISLNGPNPEELAKVRGRFTFDLDDATLVALPIFKELDRFLGASRGGGLFDDGDIAGNISNETIYIEQLTLNGRMVQLHALGSVTFGGGLNLEVLINTNQLIPQSGLALLNIIPGLGEAIGRSEQVVMRLASFLSSKLLKFRVTGNIKNPTVTLDPGVDVGDSAVGFFSNVLKVPGGG